MNRKLRAIIFDLDGTLYVSGELGREISLSACRYIASLQGVTPDEAALLIQGARERLSAVSGVDTPLTHACQELGGDIQELHRHFAAEIRPEQYLTVDRRVVDLLQTLGERAELYIYTNNNRQLATRIMKAIGIDGMFRRLFTIEDSWTPKPDRETLRRVLVAIDRGPGECLFVGDRYDIDLRAPAEAGCAVYLSTRVEDLFNLITIISEGN